jgi:ABC-type transport system involved in multi-copper enzyme maturation permease subunit
MRLDFVAVPHVRLVSAEVLKLRTTQAWWLFLVGFPVVSALAVAMNANGNNQELHPAKDVTNYAQLVAQGPYFRSPAGAATMAASMMTSGQFVLVLITLILGVHVMTSEFAARTITATFLVEPRRPQVVLAKLTVSGLFGVTFWAIATVLGGVAAPLFLAAEHLPSPAFNSSVVVRAVLMGLLAFVLWGLIGLGLGAVLRNQAIAVVAAIGIYAGGFFVVKLIVTLLYNASHISWLPGLAVLAPAEATDVMITAGRAFAGAPPWWVGALIMTGYAIALTRAGIVQAQRTDIT